MRALALEHLRPDPIGIFGDVLEERGIEVDRVMLDQGDEVPDSRRYDLVVAMGAALSVWEEDEFPWLVAEKRAIREAVLSGVPYFGVCFGAQLLADVLGGRSYGGPEPELGASQVFLTAAARRDPVFRGFPPDLEVLEWHTNHFDLPPGGIRLARSPRYENQAIRFGRVAYGIQCHLEPSLEDIRAWFEGFPTLSEVFEARHGAGSVEAFLGEYATFVPLLQATGRQLFGRWLENALALGGLGLAAQAVHKARAPVLEAPAGTFGRDAERGRIDIAVRAAREGKSAVIVLRGEAGIGKTALLDDAVQRSTGLRVLRIRGEDSEPELPFSGLVALCRPLAGYLGAIEPARAERLAGVLGLEGPARAEDRFSVYAGTLDLLAAAAEETPLLVVVDDAHWLEDATSEAIAFVAQRLDTDGIALLVATEAEDDFPGLEELRLAGLDLPASLALLEASYGEQLAPDVADLVVEAASGNPLALLEIPLGLTTAERAGEQPIREALPASAEWAFLRRLAALPADARRALLVASLTADGDLDQIGRSCAELGVDVSALEAAEAAGMVHNEGGALAFRHALARTAVCYSALRADRRAAHTALARSTDGEVRLWHLARAAAGADEEVASGLERAARRADHQGAHATAARALELAARLTPDGDSGAKRLLAAARSAHLAGHVHAALDHLDAALRRAREHSLRTDIEHLRGRIAARSGSAERARDLLVATADLCERDDPEKAAEMLADAVLPALRAGAPAQACEIARRAMDLVRGRGGRAELVATVMLGTALVLTGEHREGTALVDRAADLADADGGLADAQLRAYVATGLARAGRNERARESLERIIDEARHEGALGILPYSLVRFAGVELECGRWALAAGALREALGLAEETGQSADHGLALGALAWLEAAQGHADDCETHVREALELAGRLGGGSGVDRAAAALGLLELGLGHPEAAVNHLEEARALQEEQGWSDATVTPHLSPDLVEAYALAGRGGDARAALDRFQRQAERSERPSALAAAARSRALLAGEEDFDVLFAEALSAGEEVPGPFERARTELLYGSRLATAGRGGEANDRLAAALETFERLGAEPWAARARSEIVGAGGAPPERQPSPLERLTSRELEVALELATGASPREAATRLLLGPRTVQLHLASAMVKLRVDSPAELAREVSSASSADGGKARTAGLSE